MLERSSQLEYVARRMCQRRDITLVGTECTANGGRFQIHNGKVGIEARVAWCTVDAATLERNRSEELVEAVALALALGIDELQGTPTPPTWRGTFRVYFNRHGAAPLVWCVAPVLPRDRVGWELAVASVSIRTTVGTVYHPKAVPDAEDGRPSAWIVATGVLTVRDGEAIITGGETPEVQQP